MSDKQKAFVYGLIDPRDASIRYVGHTANSMAHRLSQHINDSANTPKTQWIAELAALGLQPGIVQLDAVDYDVRFQEEYRWIYLGRQRGWALTNTTAMKTDRYSEIASNASRNVFVEMMPILSWSLIKRYLYELLWQDNVRVEYVIARIIILFLPLLGILAGSILISSSDIAFTIIGQDASSLMVGGGDIGFVVIMVSCAIALLIALPIYVNGKKRQLADVYESIKDLVGHWRNAQSLLQLTERTNNQ